MISFDFWISTFAISSSNLNSPSFISLTIPVGTLVKKIKFYILILKYPISQNFYSSPSLLKGKMPLFLSRERAGI